MEPSNRTQNEKIKIFFLNSLSCSASSFDFKTLMSTLPELILLGFKGFSETLISFGVSIFSVFSVKPLVVIFLLKHINCFEQFNESSIWVTIKLTTVQFGFLLAKLKL